MVGGWVRSGERMIQRLRTGCVRGWLNALMASFAVPGDGWVGGWVGEKW